MSTIYVDSTQISRYCNCGVKELYSAARFETMHLLLPTRSECDDGGRLSEPTINVAEIRMPKVEPPP
jgi:hypothetical protein